MSTVLAYLRVSTEEQGESGAGLAAQRRVIHEEAGRRGWQDLRWIEDIASGKDQRRPGLQAALAALKAYDAQTLCVAKMDRLSRSLLDYTKIRAQAAREGWTLIALDCPADTASPAGEAMASMMTVFAEMERRLIGERTRNALAERRAAGIVLGRPRSDAVPDATRQRIATERARSRSYAAIAHTLNMEGIPTAHGGTQWYPQTVRRMVLQYEAA